MGSTTCPRCRNAVPADPDGTWDVAADAAGLRRQGWIGFGTGPERRAVHLSCLTYSESEAVLGGSRAEPAAAGPAVRSTGRFRRSPTEAAVLADLG